MFNNQIIAGAAGQGGSFYPYSIDQSLRFNDSDSAYLSRTPASAGNRDTWTISMWVKRSGLGLTQSKLFGAGSSFPTNHNDAFYMWFQSDDTLRIFNESSGAYYTRLDTTRVFRDTAGWYHIVYVYDSSQATSTDRQKLYINGVKETAFDLATYPALNQDSQVNATHLHVLGATTITNTFDGYMAEVNFIDGTALDADSFGETINGVWVPKEYSGSYGTNGFYLSFADSSAIGDDLSGNTNDWTANNLAATDVVSDSPTNSFCTLNPLTAGTFPTLKEGNLSIATVYAPDLCGVTSTWYPTSGKWYWEVHNEGVSTYPYLGITDQRQTLTSATQGSFYSVAWTAAGTVASQTGTSTYMGTITTNTVATWANNDIIMFALDVDARKLWVGKNGTWDGSGDPAAGTGEDASWTEDTGVSPMFMGYNSEGVSTVFNFGQDGTFAGNQTAQGNADDNGVGDFYYSPPSGFLAMATSNIEDGDISPNSAEQADDYFNTVLYTGNATDNTAITGVGFQSDWTWIKLRSAASSHVLHDSVRGANKQLFSNLTNAEESSTTKLKSFDSDGFTLGDNSTGTGSVNSSGNTHVAWNWKAGTSVSGTTTGSGTGQAYTGSVNTDAGFSIIAYTGNGTAGHTIPHHLGVAPKMVISKKRSASGSWGTYHDGLTSASHYILLNDTAAEDSNTVYFNGTAPTDTVVTRGTGADGNANGVTYIQYAFAEIEGYSKVGKYRGNGSANGTFVYTGFRPAWFMVKRSDSTGWWGISDSERSPYNEIANTLAANESYSESTLTSDLNLDFLSNGFKIRDTDGYYNASGGNYIYLVFAEAPFKYANAR